MSTTNTKNKINLKGMTKAEARVAIAKDVLKQIKVENLVPEMGTYFRSLAIEEADGDAQVSKVVRNAKCTVCAVGAAFVCAAKRFNAVKLAEVGGGDGSRYLDAEDYINPGIAKYLTNFFSPEQLSLMECAFEGKPVMAPRACSASLRRATGFRDALETEDATLILTAIMHNIIKNKGTFKP
jgi:hypothetical protein